MIIKNASLETVCGYTSKLPKNTKPEIAFAGKSNVGKSSLINALKMCIRDRKMATMYNMEADKLKEYMGEDEKENMKQDLAVQKAVELITESVKPRAKAKTKKEKEAEAETEAAE